MHVKFPHLSLGYIGVPSISNTLNSKYFSMFFSEKIDLQKRMYFPQRIPKQDFFNEILRLENKKWSAYFHKKQNALLQYICDQLNNCTDPLVFKNSINLALRFGLSKRLKIFFSKLNLAEFNQDIESEFSFQILLLQNSLENESYFDSIALENILQRTIADSKLNILSKAMILTCAIVWHSRFKIALKKSLIKLIHVHLESTLALLPKNFIGCLYRSVCLRGLAMSPFISTVAKQSMLEKAEWLAYDLLSEKCESKNLLARENLYTFLQTKVKWSINQKNYCVVEECFAGMTELDPYDSTAYSEYAFYFLKSNKPKLAEKKFSEAVKHGPPGVAMHLYYEAHCCKILNQNKKSTKLLLESIKADDQAVSPYLDLLTTYRQLDEKQKYTEILTKLLTSKKLRSQLTKNEICEMSNVEKN